jgi:hypothetical protein
MTLDSQDFLIDPYALRGFAACFTLVIPLDDFDACIEEAVRNNHRMEQQINATLTGNFSFWDYMESIEPYVVDMDDYLNEVEQNLEQQIQIYRN